jgi:hypothetical protein
MSAKLITPRLAALVVAAAQLFAGTASACKTRIYPEQFPIDELANYAHVYVIRVEAIDWARPLELGAYAPPFTLSGRIERSLKGPMHSGDAIRATTSTDEPHAVCPIYLEVGKTYLLMLNGTKSPYVLPRYRSLFVASDDKLFTSYVSAIANSAKSADAQ